MQSRTIAFSFLISLFSISLPLSASQPAIEHHQEDKAFLERIQKDSARYFLELSHTESGLVLDSSRNPSSASIAATGFGLAAIAISSDKGWISKEEGKNRLIKTMQFLLKKAEHKNGFFYHFLDPKSGKRIWKSEASSMDTALLIAGAQIAGAYFKGTPIETLAQTLYDRVDWAWMLNGSSLLCHGWKPESGFLPYYWDSYSELIVLQALAIGSPTHPVPPKVWESWDRFEDEYAGYPVVYSHSGSLFTYQYSHAFIDFRKLRDREINYFKNSINATMANQALSIAYAEKYLTYRNRYWGLSACVGPGGYRAYGAKPGLAIHDGTVAPYASICSIVFTPEISLENIRRLFELFDGEIYGKYGFRDGFNLDKNWRAQEYLGIDQGLTVVMIENWLEEGVWKRFMKLHCVKRWITSCGLSPKTDPPISGRQSVPPPS